MKNVIVALSFLASVVSFSFSLQAAPGGASALAKGHGKAVSAAAKDPERIKGKGGVSATAKGHGQVVSGSVRQNAPEAAPAPVAP